MVTKSTDKPRILIVDDQEDITNLYDDHLNELYDVRRAYNGQDAIQKVDETVDVVLLDRRMPDFSGDEVLTQIRAMDVSCQVIMVTAVDPEADIVEMEFDDYLHKPVDRDELRDAVEHQLTVREYSETYQELNRAYSKLTALEAEKSVEGLEMIFEYQELKRKVERLESEQEDLLEELDYFEAASARQ
ncbi:MAG: HoxA-like transcriptional regulator [Halonotius sp. J07HN4]|jgi:Response regulators consisting of a CheY-like receiver domain and a winged-helix DNA-binding domain|nr:MAG: HoxA-like transcriptional regulator [Halonotius sp. J07HN4]